jgi:hypothetical protein
MLSKIEGETVDQSSQLQWEQLKSLTNQIDEYVAKEQWEFLLVVLELRQHCLEAMFSAAEAENESLRSLADSILEQDAIFVAKIQTQQKIVEKLIVDLGKGRQATQAYGAS